MFKICNFYAYVIEAKLEMLSRICLEPEPNQIFLNLRQKLGKEKTFEVFEVFEQYQN
jgi:hypothetical protein